MRDDMREDFDLRRFLLLIPKRLWILALGAVLGACLFGAFSYLKQNVFAAAPLYRNDTLYMIEFTEGEQDETQLYFNDYTWNDVIDSDLIAGAAARLLEGVEREQIAEATTVPTMSDIRFFHIYVDCTDAELADRIQNALEISLGGFSYRARGFDAISVWTRGSAKLLVEKSTIMRWMVAGAIAGALLGACLLAGIYILDDGIRLAADLESAGVHCLGVLFKQAADEREEAALKAALAGALKDCTELRIVDPAGTAVSAQSAERLRALLPEGIKTEEPSADAKRLYCVAAGSIGRAELKRQTGGRREPALLCEASRRLHRAYYFYGIKDDGQG